MSDEEVKQLIAAARTLRRCVGHTLQCAKSKSVVKCDCGAARRQADAVTELDRALSQIKT